MHSGSMHTGKVPTYALNRQSYQTRLRNLKSAVVRAIEEEAYEKAAQYRDQIQALEIQESNQT